MTKHTILLCFILVIATEKIVSGFRIARDVRLLDTPSTVEDELSNSIDYRKPTNMNAVSSRYAVVYEKFQMINAERMKSLNNTITKFLKQYLSDGSGPGPFEFLALIPNFTRPAKCLQKFIASIPKLFNDVARAMVEVASHLMAGAYVGYDCIRTYGTATPWESSKCIYDVIIFSAGNSFNAQLKIIFDTAAVLAHNIIRPGWLLDCEEGF